MITKEYRDAVLHLKKNRTLSFEQFKVIFLQDDKESLGFLNEMARAEADKVFSKKIYVRGLLEFTNYCHNDCFYCGIRGSNATLERYRLTEEEIYSAVESAYNLRFRTVVLQGGEDDYYTDSLICKIVSTIKSKYPDIAVTLSIGEKSYESYVAYKKAGADRYLLRHETADESHYQKLHPKFQTFQNRMRCLADLKSLGFQTGCGFMVGSPFQTLETLYKDLKFIKDFEPHMVGIGPFIPSSSTPFWDKPTGTLTDTTKLLSIIRLLNPKLLLPSTTALGTISPTGREQGILAGANVLMPNITPSKFRKQYALYDNKICTGEECAECLACLSTRIQKIGYHLDFSRGDYPNI